MWEKIRKNCFSACLVSILCSSTIPHPKIIFTVHFFSSIQVLRVYVQKTEKKKQQPYPAGQPSLFMVRCHTESLNKELYSFVNAVLIIKTQASNVKCICIRGIQSQDITVKTDLLLWQCKSIYLCSFRNFIRLLHETLATWMSLTLVRHQVWCAQTMQWPLTKYAT